MRTVQSEVCIQKWLMELDEGAQPALSGGAGVNELGLIVRRLLPKEDGAKRTESRFSMTGKGGTNSKRGKTRKKRLWCYNGISEGIAVKSRPSTFLGRYGCLYMFISICMYM